MTGDDPSAVPSEDGPQTPTEGYNLPAKTESDAPGIPSGPDGGATQFLERFLRLHVFLDLHEQAGHPENHKLRGHVCFGLDLALHLLAALLLLGIVAAIAYKTLFPLPHVITGGSK